jgi:magnesium-protoporphyrin O-methyltransferase
MHDEAPCSCGCPNTFSTKEAEGDLRRYRDKGPDPTTRALVDAIAEGGIDGATVIDVGGGVGAVQLELLAAGASRSISVDASEAYAAVYRDEVERRALADRVEVHVGDFVDLAGRIEPADIVTLDRVVCCYSNFRALLGSVAFHARSRIGVVWPRDVWWNRIASRVLNAWSRLTRNPTRWYLHREADLDALLRIAGFRPRPIKRTFMWQVVVYERHGSAGSTA